MEINARKKGVLRAWVLIGAVAAVLLLPGRALAAAPTVVTKPADTVTASSAWVNGTVNANDRPTQWWFEYASDDEYKNSNGAYAHSTPMQLLGFNGLVPLLFVTSNVSRNLSGLDSATTYHFRVAASNSDGSSHGGDLTFTTS